MTDLRHNLAACLPPIAGLDWDRSRRTPFVFVGAGAGNRPLAEHLAWLGMCRCVIVDPKRYKELSVVSQCEPEEVGRFKADVLAERLRKQDIGAEAVIGDV